VKTKSLFLTLLFLLAAASWIGAGEKPLDLVQSTPADQASGVALEAEIVLEFSNNVVNMSVAENNAACFSLRTAEGVAVPLEVRIPDDQVEPEMKRIITLIPAEPLKRGTRYEVVILPGLTAKNGSQLGKEIRLTFSTQP